MTTIQFDPRAPEFRADPYPFYAMLRTYAPVFYWEEWDMWFLTRHEDCNTLLRDNRLGHGELMTPPPSQRPLFEMQSHWMLLKNPPDHTRLRSLVHKAFTPRMIERLRDTIQRITDALLDQVQADGQMDLIAISTLLRRMPHLALAADAPVYNDNYVLRGLNSLPVIF